MRKGMCLSLTFSCKTYNILMNIREKIVRSLLLAGLLLTVGNGTARAQIDLTIDTLQCPIVGFNAGVMIPSTKFSFETAPDGLRSQNATMASLYNPPYLSFGIEGMYKFKSNWLATLEGDLWFGMNSNNLNHRIERMSDLFTRDSTVIGANGTDANVTCYNRGLSFKAGIGKIFPLNPVRNPNSGILARVSGGYMWQQTIFLLNNERAPQLSDDYALLYDHQRNGFMLTEGLGYWFMSTRSDLANIYVLFEVTQCWNHSTREYMIDNYLGLRGKDNHRYFDLLYSIKICWMFPLRGKADHDYYLY